MGFSRVFPSGRPAAPAPAAAAAGPAGSAQQASFTAMVFWCGGGLFSAPEAAQREKVGKIGKRLFLILAPEAVQQEKVRKIGKRLFLIGFQKGR